MSKLAHHNILRSRYQISRLWRTGEKQNHLRMSFNLCGSFNETGCRNKSVTSKNLIILKHTGIIRIFPTLEAISGLLPWFVGSVSDSRFVAETTCTLTWYCHPNRCKVYQLFPQLLLNSTIFTSSSALDLCANLPWPL